MNLDQAVQLAVDTLKKGGLSDITDASLEIDLIKDYEGDLVDQVTKSLKKASVQEMGFSSVQYILTPKNRYVFDYRKAAIIQPADVVKFNSLVFQFAHQVERRRVPVSERVVFSYRFLGKDGVVFDPDIGFSEWLARNKEIRELEDVKFVVECDIAAFYDRVNIHRIESALLDAEVDGNLVKYVNDLLLIWSSKDSYGLPVGSVASRILAEAALMPIDDFLRSQGVKYTRFVDDFRLFSPDLVTAQKWMNKLTTRLFKDGLMLNTGKTKVSKVLSKDEVEKLGGEEETSDMRSDGEAEKVLKVISSLTGGYNRIVRHFIMPSEERHSAFKEVDVKAEIEVLEGQDIVAFSGIQKVVIACIVKKQFTYLARIAKLCSKFLYGLDYFVDMLLKNAEFIPGDVRDQLADYYAGLLRSSEYYEFEWHCSTLARLLGNPSYFRKQALIHVFNSSGKEVTTYPSLVALDGLIDKLTRNEFLEMRDSFQRCDAWERRRLIRASSALPVPERKAFARAVLPIVRNDVLATSQLKKLRNAKR